MGPLAETPTAKSATYRHQTFDVTFNDGHHVDKSDLAVPGKIARQFLGFLAELRLMEQAKHCLEILR